MQSGFTTIPFKIEGLHGGLSEAEGIGKFSSAGIVLEFEAKILGLLKTGVKEVRIPLAEILDVNFKKGFFKYSAKIQIRLNNFSRLSELPNKDGKISLKVSRDDFERARETVQTLQKYLNEYTQSLPPAQVSVSELFEDETKELK
jgi:hypothetical protein